MSEKEELNQITQTIIGAAIEVHKNLGPGLLESAYETCLAFELAERGVKVEKQKPLPLMYKGITLDCGYRLDLLVEGKAIIEIKAVDEMNPVYNAQLLSYLKLTNCKIGLLINFNVLKLTNGITRIVNNFPD
jgi:GxxExxY protein